MQNGQGAIPSPSPAGGDPFWQKNKRIYHFLPIVGCAGYEDTKGFAIRDTKGYARPIRAAALPRKWEGKGGRGEERRKERKGERCLARCSRTSPPLG